VTTVPRQYNETELSKAAGGLKALPELIQGTALRVAVGNKLKNGLTTPFIAGVLGPA
jgi:hypothetical protein